MTEIGQLGITFRMENAALRKVENCHPPESVHVVTEIFEDFRVGKRDTASFWIDLKGQLVYIRYFAVRDGKGQYVGASGSNTEYNAFAGA